VSIRISNARVKSWRRCRCLHYYKYVLDIEKKKPSRPLVMGKMIHALKEAIIEGVPLRKALKPFKKEYEKMFLEEKEEYGDIINDVYEIMANYKDYYSDEELEYVEIDGKKSEHHFIVPLNSDINLEFVIDAIAEDPQGRKWIQETKSFKKMPKEEVRFTDLQTTIYYEGLKILGYDLHGIIWDYIRSKPPAVPDELKDGGLSKRKNIDTTYAVYLNEIIDRGLDPNDYADILEGLVGREDQFFRRIYMPPPDTIVKPLLKDLMETAYEISYLGDSKIRSLTWECSRCDYYSLCQAELRGLDTEYIIKSEYKERGNRNGNEKEEELE